MATSTIFADIRITEKEDIEAFIKAIEESEAELPLERKELPGRFVTDPDEILQTFEKWRDKHK